MNIIGIIPARFASSRLPGKPLLQIQGKTMIQRVYEQCLKTKVLNTVIVATDDVRIEQEVQRFGGQVVMTSPKHNTGTERCAEVLEKMNKIYDVVLNIQGDEPFIDPLQIEKLVACFKNPRTEIATLIKKIDDSADLFDVNRPKVVIREDGQALYFSRQAIPMLRDVKPDQWLNHGVFYKHIGLYAYKADVLKKLVKLQETPLEKLEKLEQLRWLEHGFTIQTALTDRDAQGIDTLEDWQKANR